MPTGQDRETIARGSLEPAERVGGHVRPGREPLRDPGAVLVGQAERRRHIPGEVRDQCPVRRSACVQDGQHAGDDGGTGTALR